MEKKSYINPNVSPSKDGGTYTSVYLGLVKWFQNLISSKEQQDSLPVASDNYLQAIIDADKKYAVMMQELENNKIERGIKNEAMRWLIEHNNAETIMIGNTPFKNCIHIMYPFVSAIMIYNEDTAKYKNSDIHKLVNEEYQRLLSINKLIKFNSLDDTHTPDKHPICTQKEDTT